MRVNKTFTVGANEINVATGLTTAAARENSMPAKRVFIQMLMGGSGLGYVMDGIPWGTVADSTVDGHVTAQLAVATATAPGGSYTDRSQTPGADIDLSKLWVHGANSGDKIKVSYDLPV
jgi:hypothetical protein